MLRVASGYAYYNASRLFYNFAPSAQSGQTQAEIEELLREALGS